MPATEAKPKSLTAASVSAAKAPGKYHDGKGTGLFLLVKPTGGKFWVQRLTVRESAVTLGLEAPQSSVSPRPANRHLRTRG